MDRRKYHRGSTINRHRLFSSETESNTRSRILEFKETEGKDDFSLGSTEAQKDLNQLLRDDYSEISCVPQQRDEMTLAPMHVPTAIAIDTHRAAVRSVSLTGYTWDNYGLERVYLVLIYRLAVQANYGVRAWYEAIVRKAGILRGTGSSSSVSFSGEQGTRD
ncbi:hypothetical protein WN51_13905 [Melipona quadrifasciata]|uniref:Uncharacterized protein n=1 Tax=Melipona quadrifasciata TaxID=166423 RepID=A0A0M8ZZ23_9HYME|nr:hypothetical protein WN51_13905 [Melipona quadrifasciata]